MPLFIHRHPKFITKNKEGRSNGWLVPIFNVHDGLIDASQHPRQVYLTVIAPGAVKGPHLHRKRWGLFTCIRGNAKVVVHTEKGYEEYLTGEDYEFATIQVPAGVPAALQNIGAEEAYMLNMPSPAWHIDDQDEHPVAFDDYTFTWPAGKEAMPPTVSINLCCYNSEEFLEETLQSIFAQTYKDWELVVINDGSTDSTESIIKEHINQGYPIVYYWQENHGLGYSRNEALKRSSGNYIAFIDHDDIWLPTKLEKQVPLFNDPEVDFVYSNFYKFDDRGHKKLFSKATKTKGNIFESLLYSYDIGILTAMLRTASFKKMDRLFDERLNLAEEYDLFMRLLYRTQAIYTPEPLAMHRVHAKMSTRLYWKRFSEEIGYVIDTFINLDPDFDKKYVNAITHAKIQLELQKAKDNMVEGKLEDARLCLAPYKWHTLRFVILYLATYLPVSCWFLLRPVWARNTFR